MPLPGTTSLKRLSRAIDHDAHPVAGLHPPRMEISPSRFVRCPGQTGLSARLAGLCLRLAIRSLARLGGWRVMFKTGAAHLGRHLSACGIRHTFAGQPVSCQAGFIPQSNDFSGVGPAASTRTPIRDCVGPRKRLSAHGSRRSADVVRLSTSVVSGEAVSAAIPSEPAFVCGTRDAALLMCHRRRRGGFMTSADQRRDGLETRSALKQQIADSARKNSGPDCSTRAASSSRFSTAGGRSDRRRSARALSLESRRRTVSGCRPARRRSRRLAPGLRRVSPGSGNALPSGLVPLARAMRANLPPAANCSCGTRLYQRDSGERQRQPAFG